MIKIIIKHTAPLRSFRFRYSFSEHGRRSKARRNDYFASCGSPAFGGAGYPDCSSGQVMTIENYK